MGKKLKTRKWSIRTKIILAATLVILCVVVFLGIGVYSRTKNDMIKMGMEQAEVCANVAVFQLDGAVLDEIHQGDMNSEAYQEYLEELRGIKKTCNVQYIYTLYTDGNKVYYGIDTDESGSQAQMGSEYVESYEDMESVFAGEEYVQDYIDSSDGDNVITVYMPIYDGNKVVAVLGSDFDADNIVERMAGFRNRVIEIGLVGLILGLIVMVLLVNRILKRIYMVNLKLEELASNEGDLTQRIELNSGDEMEVIAENVNTLLAYIREIMLDISNGSVDLNDSVRKVVKDMSNSRGSVEDVSATMEQMSAGLQQTSASLSRINESVEDMYARVRTMYESAEDSNRFTKDIQEKASGIFQKAKTEQQSAYQKSGEIAALVKEKIQESKSVEEIHLLTENILEITSQTNLLALNASIEAARAGEAGRGFAVVADEIGNLANNSAEAASKIQQVSNQVIAAVEGLADEADRLIKFVNETAMAGYRDLLTTSEDYRKDAEEIHNVMNGFASAATDLEHTADSIKEMVEAVDMAVDENVKGIMNVTETVADLTNVIVDIEKETEHNRAISDNFQVEVGKFKLS